MKSTTVFMDLETGGVEDCHPDIQIAAIAVLGWEELATFERKIRFDASAADPEALAMNSYDAQLWKDHAIAESVVVPQFVRFLKNFLNVPFTSQAGNQFYSARFAGHNAQTFDGPRIGRMFKRNGDAFCPGTWFQPLDTCQLALWHFSQQEKRPKNYKLGTLCEFFGISTEGAHDALTDVRLTVQLARRLLEG